MHPFKNYFSCESEKVRNKYENTIVTSLKIFQFEKI